MIKAILFDFFGVIGGDTFIAWMDAHGYTRDDEPGRIARMMDTGQITYKERFVMLGELTGQTAAEVEAEFDANRTFNDELISYIEELGAQYTLVLLSNADAALLRKILKDKGIDTLFDEIVISSEHGFAKPDKAMFDYALEQLNMGAEDAVFVDDNEDNVRAAESYGIQSIQYVDFDSFREQLENTLA